MRRFVCECGQRLFFEDFICLGCRRPVGFAPWRTELVLIGDESHGRSCRNRADHAVCNWLIPPGDTSDFCLACRLNRVIPNLGQPWNVTLWGRLERADRKSVV